ncbi:MAG TPA: alkaline shock response membrane anchor protein AmaP [Saccharofermentans sp.]|nr:alkaline shock response membrane anchor protein AmaP [Saccharofermentans sp.]
MQMNGFMKVLMFIYSVLIALLSIILVYAFIDDGIFADLLSPLSSIVTNPSTKYYYLIILLLLLTASIWSITYCITSGNLTKTRVRQSEIGTVDNGADALESIALNSAKTAQVGIKNARVRVSLGKSGSIKVYIYAALYSNVEIPSSMSRVQEKVKKDIERYTGLAVESVVIKVSRVEPIVAKVDK